MQPPFFRTHPAPISHVNPAYEETVLKTVNVTYVGSLQANEGGNDRYSKAEHSVFCVLCCENDFQRGGGKTNENPRKSLKGNTIIGGLQNSPPQKI